MIENPEARTQARVLIVDDVPANLKMLRDVLKPEGYGILVASDGQTALGTAAHMLPDIILLDIMMPGMNGYEVCRKLKGDPSTEHIPVVFVTAMDEAEGISEGFRSGGVDYITRPPLKKEEVLARVETHLKISHLTQELLQRNTELTSANQKLEQEIARREQAEDALQTADEHLSIISQSEAERWGIAGFVAQSKTMAKIMEDVRRIQKTGATSVLITGESGTGKELIARAIHFGSTRASKPFIPINCSAIPPELAESTLFGHVQGAFSGASASRKGCFELADGGTLFLDEIGDMPLELQPKLLRVLEDGCVVPVGGTQERHVDVRIVAATNQDLLRRSTEGAFREDIYFRLARFPVIVPPLRERRKDIPVLAEHFLGMFAAEMGISQPVLPTEALKMLESYHFPGNVRELKNIIERALLSSSGEPIIKPAHLHFINLSGESAAKAETDRLGVPLNLEQAESMLIEYALQQTGDNIAAAARMLSTSRPKIYRYLMKKERSG